VDLEKCNISRRGSGRAICPGEAESRMCISNICARTEHTCALVPILSSQTRWTILNGLGLSSTAIVPHAFQPPGISPVYRNCGRKMSGLHVGWRQAEQHLKMRWAFPEGPSTKDFCGRSAFFRTIGIFMAVALERKVGRENMAGRLPIFHGGRANRLRAFTWRALCFAFAGKWRK